jgi:molecular chaperone DnaK
LDIDANGILNVSAKDKATGKEQSIVIKASSGLSDDEVDAMVKDAEAHADEDKKTRELVDARNQADGLVHATEKSLSEYGDKVDEAEKTKVTALVGELKELVQGDDKDAIEKKSQELMEASGTLAQAAAGGEAGAAPEGEQTASAEDDDVVDAEFEEVVDDKEGDKKA